MFYRATRSSPGAHNDTPTRQPARPAIDSPSPSRLSTEVTAEQFEAGVAPDQPVFTEQMPEGSSRDLPPLSSPETPHPVRRDTGRGASARQRSSKAVQSLSTYPAAATPDNELNTCNLSEISMVCTVAHMGMEVLFASVPTKRAVVMVCSRTRVLLQTLELPSGKATIVSLLSSPLSGMVSVGMSDGVIQTYRPIPTSASPSSDPSAVAQPFGKYRWLPAAVVRCCEVFYLQDGVQRLDLFSPTSVDISLSGDDKILVSHRDQLAVFDVAPAQVSAAELLWTTRMDATVSSAKLSGDGRAIVVVVEGEGIGKPDPYGARTFVRDMEDGSGLALPEPASLSRPHVVERTSSSGTAVGIVYKPGPFLIHTTPVSRISFRGLGHITSNVKPEDDEGNDLILTYCNEDCSVRIFSQNSWKQLMHWHTPPYSRADWVRGISAFNLGDLDSRKKQNPNSSANSRHPSISSAEDSADINAGLSGGHGMPSIPPSANPTSAAGAWIAELTFRNSFPGLRLSRLSYMNRGSDEYHAAHFESVAAILPSSSLEAESVLQAGDLSLSVEGIWPAWLPWSSGISPNDTEIAPGGSAMALLGLSAGVLPSAGMFGESHSNGTHGPPSELRVVASHPKTGKIVLMEFPLWGDLDFGAMELGNPVRYLLAVSEASDLQREPGEVFSIGESQDETKPVYTVYGSDVLCAQIHRRRSSIELTWRKAAAMSVIPASPTAFHSAMSFSDSVETAESFDTKDPQTRGDLPDVFQDSSVVPVPISLPSLRLPRNIFPQGKDKLVSLLWWTDQRIGGSPFLIATTRLGSLIVYELPPLWSSLEPSMPNFDPFQISRTASAVSFAGSDESAEDGERREYEVMITPHPDFGIGLRLEAQHDGKPAIAGSFKKHPLNGGILPAERTGMIMLGDELLSVNSVSLEGIPFDETIATVRKVGSETKKGEPICLLFRPSAESRFHLVKSTTLSESQRSEASNRRSMEQILGVPSRRSSLSGDSDGIARVESDDADSHISMLVGAESELQQEMSRVVAVVENGAPTSESTIWAVLPIPKKHQESRSTLLVMGSEASLTVKLLRISDDRQPDKAECLQVGSLDLTKSSSTDSSIDEPKGKIVSVERATHYDEKLFFIVTRRGGHASLVLLEIDGTSTGGSTSSPRISVKFQSSPVFKRDPLSSINSFNHLVRASSTQLIGSMSVDGTCGRSITVWAARPSPALPNQPTEYEEKSEMNRPEYVKAAISVQPFFSDEDDELVDFCFVPTGTLDSFPLLVAMTRTVAVAYRRSGASFEWTPVVTLRYPECSGPSRTSKKGIGVPVSPVILFPHLIPTILSLVSVTDEKRYLKSDWHPEAILAFTCTEGLGAGTALKRNVKGVYCWLSRWMDPDETARPFYSSKYPLDVAPLRSIGGDSLLKEGEAPGARSDDAVESASALFAHKATEESRNEPSSKELPLLINLQQVLCPSHRAPTTKDSPYVSGLILPPPLTKLNDDELRLLWAVGEMLTTNPPNFKRLDSGAQMTLFCLSLVQTLKQGKNDVGNGDSVESSASSTIGMNRSSFLVKSRHVRQSEEPSRPSMIASAGCVSAISSCSQGRLLETCRPVGGKYDWDSARELRIPLWLRSVSQLQKMSDEIGQAVYRQTRDIMESALFFIIVRNSRSLKNLAATDRSESGRKFSKFIATYDFSSERGRKAAEKNAYSLLRKRKYRAAATFFLLPEPPMLKTALEIMVTQMQDFELAFMTARLMENATKTGIRSNTVGVGAPGLAGMIGGGAGFAASGTGLSSEVTDDQVSFTAWTPDIGTGTKDLIRRRGFPEASTDPCLRALLFIWLRQKEKGTRCLSGLANSEDSDAVARPSFRVESMASVPRSVQFSDGLLPNRPEGSANDRVVARANSFINFTACPFLTTALGASARTRWASSLFVSRALSRRGLELQAARSILQNTDIVAFNRNEMKERSKQSGQAKTASSLASDSVGASRPVRPTSIFDSYDVAPPRSAAETGGVSSSVFDSFDAPRPAKGPKPAAPQSSIFDDFDTPPKQTKKQGSGARTSIFDSFEPAPQKPKQEEEAASSIFDSFETAPQIPKHATLAVKADPSIFDSFDTAAPRKNSPLPHIESQKSPFPAQQAPEEAREPEDETDVDALPTPELWKDWRESILVEAVGRRLIREIARTISRFRADVSDVPMRFFRKHVHPLVPSNVGEILHNHCAGDEVLSDIRSSIEDISTSCQVDKNSVTASALRILSSDSSPARIVFAALLLSAGDRDGEADCVVRHAAMAQIARCDAFVIANDELVDNRKTSHHVSSQHLRRLSARVSWQLELCLWLHRGGALLLSSLTMKEATVAVRTGLLLASWGRSPECLESIMRCEPDCAVDDEAGRQLWSSMKLLSGLEDKVKKVERAGSGGWEFLVECKRDEATGILRPRPCGSFLIRPHHEKTGVFTLSFKTNLVPTKSPNMEDIKAAGANKKGRQAGESNEEESAAPPKPVRKDDVVQHAVIRLSDSGFRCGSFGPFTSLMSLLEAVSSSLPFDLLFNEPPTQAMIKNEGSQPSPNAVFLRKFALTAHSERFRWNGENIDAKKSDSDENQKDIVRDAAESRRAEAELARRRRFGMFLQLSVLSEIRRQLCAVVAAAPEVSVTSWSFQEKSGRPDEELTIGLQSSTEGDISEDNQIGGAEHAYSVASRLMRPLLTWCRAMEIRITPELAPDVVGLSRTVDEEHIFPAALKSETVTQEYDSQERGDAIIRRMIQRDSGVEFRTIRVGEAGESAMIVLFSKTEAVNWLVKSGLEVIENDALARLEWMESQRVIEPIDSADMAVKPVGGSVSNVEEEKVRYRFVDPWEVEVLGSREAETMGASLGREHFFEFSVTSVATSCEDVFRSMGGVHLLGLWAYAKGGLRLSKAIASVHAPWERDAGGDLQMAGGCVIEPPLFANNIRQHLYRNALFRRLRTPQRFLALVQVELLDLKNLTSPGGSPSLSVYALLRLKRPGSSSPLTHKARTLDSAATEPTKLGKSSGPNAPASWGSVVRFRFPLPESVNCDGVSADSDREALFRGPPSVLQISVYEKKFMSDVELGCADIKLDGLTNGGQMEEWVPLRSLKQGHSGTGGISWFARIRLTLRFELMCLESDNVDSMGDRPHSVGLRRIQQLSKLGGAHEDTKGIVKRSSSTTDLFSYIENNFF